MRIRCNQVERVGLEHAAGVWRQHAGDVEAARLRAGFAVQSICKLY